LDIKRNAIAVSGEIVRKKSVGKTFEKRFKPVWARVRQFGLTEEYISALIEEARSTTIS